MLKTVAQFVFLAAIVMAYFRYRDTIFDLAAATDSKQSGDFLKFIALLFAILVVVLYMARRKGHLLFLR